MSRHLLPNPEGTEPGSETVVGWDVQTATYFLQINPPQDSEATAVWLGLTPQEFYSLEDFLPVLFEHGIKPSDDLVATLYFDRDQGRSNHVVDWRSDPPVLLA